MAGLDPFSSRRRFALARTLALALVVGSLAAGGWFLTRSGGRGQPEDPAHVLIVGPTPELVELLEREGFDVAQASASAAVSQGRSYDPQLAELPAMLEYADRSGFGYVALDLAHGERYAFDALELERVGHGVGEAGVPPGSTFAVLGVGDLAGTLSFGGPIPEVAHDKPAGEFVGLMLALFDQPDLAKARDRQATNDLMIRFDSAGTLDHLEDLERARDRMARQAEAWRELGVTRAEGEVTSVEFAQPYERVVAWPLANGSVLEASLPGAWHSLDGLDSSWSAERRRSTRAQLWIRTWDADASALGPRERCPALPETVDLDAFSVAPEGDALLIPATRWIADLWVLERGADGAAAPGCAFTRADPIRRLAEGELGQARSSGRTAEVLDGRLQWADARMRAYRQVQLRDLELRSYGLRWLGGATVVAPGVLSLEPDAESSDAGSPAVIVWVRLPEPRVEDRVEVALVPLEAVVAPLRGVAKPETPKPETPTPEAAPSAPAVSEFAILDLFPLPASEGAPGPALIALVDGPESASLIELRWANADAPWANALDANYDLDAVLRSGSEQVRARVLTTGLPAEAHDLRVAPDGGRVAWVAPANDEDEADGGDPSADPQRTLEVFLLALDDDQTVGRDRAPRRLTTNARSDSQPRFAGPAHQLLLVDSRYHPDDRLPVIESTRALVLEP